MKNKNNHCNSLRMQMYMYAEATAGNTSKFAGEFVSDLNQVKKARICVVKKKEMFVQIHIFMSPGRNPLASD